MNNVREWAIPKSFFGSEPNGIATGIIYHPRERSQEPVWFTLELAHSLVSLNPTVGLFTAYRGVEFPIRYPRHLMFDSSGLKSNGIQVNPYKPGHPIIYFSRGSGIVIGQLIT